jgi:hypothetical protein
MGEARGAAVIRIPYLEPGHAALFTRADAPDGRWSRASTEPLHQALDGAIEQRFVWSDIEAALQQLQPARDTDEAVWVHFHAGSSYAAPIITINDRCVISTLHPCPPLRSLAS